MWVQSCFHVHQCCQLWVCIDTDPCCECDQNQKTEEKCSETHFFFLFLAQSLRALVLNPLSLCLILALLCFLHFYFFFVSFSLFLSWEERSGGVEKTMKQRNGLVKRPIVVVGNHKYTGNGIVWSLIIGRLISLLFLWNIFF